ncbi:MAG TPA: C13 family peptidase [Candidatus Binatia bacterium]|nr:C13 family peptidase [Candidatus Binatia bacterium]
MMTSFEFAAEKNPGLLSTLLQSSANAFRLALFQQIAADRFRITWWQVAAFGAATVLLPVMFDLSSIGINGQFNGDAIPSAIAHLPIILFAAIVTAYVLRSSEKTLFILQAFLMIAAAIDLIVYSTYCAAVALYPQPWPDEVNIGYRVIPPIWLALACARAAASPLAGNPSAGVLAYVACIVLLVLPLTQIKRERSLWHAANRAGESADPGKQPLAEDVLYSQTDVLERELAAVRPGRRGLIDVYFVGVGGYANQDVFMKEVDAVSRLFRERFGSQGKTIRLVNNFKSLADSPIASVTSLRKSLQRVAEVMNNGEDLLFLFLTSHGSATHRFSLDFSPLKLHELDPEKLRALLDQSGIKNRVVVISACYSGGFIEPLKNENTLAISASAPDKNSFGCSNEAEWTYFGKAFFDEALRKTHSFVEALEIAKPVIAGREKEQGYTPSEPQMALGEDLRPILMKLERQLDSQQ